MISITVAYATPKQQFEIPLTVENNTTVALAIRRSGLLDQCPEIPWPNVQVGIFSRKVTLDAPLQDGDRVEIYRPLEIDPMSARRLRAKRRSKE